ncbi:MAG: MetQ/NlpA family ABC transporter substrate-binding protein [Lachnospiraceae bacterium]|nr:MetQ/NlpA family ABC transporter substrate-binding protein [Lachnospiraceae bacterium]
MMKRLGRKVVALLIVGVVACQMIGCGSSASTSSKNDNIVSVAATPVPHADILNQIIDDMKEKGYDLTIQEYTDYIIPNLAVEQGEVMANFFQHTPYLDEFNTERGTHIVSIGKVHYEPFGIYAGTKDEFTVSNGDKIAVPNDVTNEARSLNLLEKAGVIKLKEGAGLTATKIDIIDNPHNIEIVELESAMIPRTLSSVAFACMNGNYAMEAGFKVSDALYIEDQSSLAAKTYANVICVKEGNEDKPWAKALVECLKSQKIKD